MQEKLLTMLIGQRVKQSRRKLNLTQEKFAEMIGIEQSSLSNIENGKNLPSFETFCSIVEKSQVSADFLLNIIGKYNKIEIKDEIDLEIIRYILNLSSKTKEIIVQLLKKN